MLVNMNITILGSCRQFSIKNKYNVTSIQDRLTYPHYTKEIIQAIEYCKGVHQFNNNLSQYCFRTGILNRSDINCQSELQNEFENTDIFIIEIASRISYKWNNVYVHHILSEPEYGFHDIPNIKICDLTDDEIENDIVIIKKLLYPKKILIVPHVYTRTSGKRYELVKLLEQLTTKYDIPFINPSELLKNETDIYEEGQAFHYSSKGNDLVEKLYKEYIDRIFHKKTVVLVWKLSYNNYPKTLDAAFWGIGDLIRGAIGLYKLSKKYNFDLIVDKSLHPISHILKNDKHMYSNYIQENNIPLVLPEDVDHYIYTNLMYNNIIYMYSNMPLNSYDGEISDELRHFINYILRPREDFKCMFDELLSKLNTYSIIHYRLGDDELVRSVTNSINYENVYSHLLNNYKPDSILITDSNKFKNLVKTRNTNIKILDTKICHIGHEESYEVLKDTLLEFFILTKATHIRSFTCYEWISGFVYSVHRIFEIPLEPHINCIF